MFGDCIVARSMPTLRFLHWFGLCSVASSTHSTPPSITRNRSKLQFPSFRPPPTFPSFPFLPSAAARPHSRSALPSPGDRPSDLRGPRSPWRRRPAAGTGRRGRCCNGTSPSRRRRGSTTTSARPAPAPATWSRRSSSGRQ
jgi:hypothetical protein